MSALDLDALEAAARAATPEWYCDQYGSLMVSESVPMYMRGATIAAAGSRVDQATKNTEFIAAANPAVVLALIERLRAAESEADKLRAGVSTQFQEFDWPDADGWWWVKIPNYEDAILHKITIYDDGIFIYNVKFTQGGARCDGIKFIRATPPVFSKD